ncbi:haloalkane dehalogenase 2 [Gordonia spumicola]|uniref:Haloalkane dehalogenase 2 n=1 Tax=Gordonia spumicola TaxID=589161 RepID=A0A7I9V5H9_9ACTN|nr:alpha/beta fold hydrolase [Gordonia spumicola]GEE00669.1 haloalkane dehalogenase 2 [Gordonia spumicola]
MIQIDRTLFPFRSRWFAAPEGRIHYIDEGSGPALLFCHGSPTWSFLFRKVVASLRDDYRCIAVDHLGFGLSERPDDFGYTVREHIAVLGEVIDHLDLDDYVIVGHDWGGPIGLGASTGRGDRLRGAVLTNTAFWPITALPNRLFSAAMGTTTMQRRIVEHNFLVEKILLGRFGPPLSDVEADHYRRVQPTPDDRRGLAVIPTEITAATPLLTTLEHDVATLIRDVPALAVWGMRDKVFPAKSCLPRVAAAFDDLSVVELPDVGHFTAEEAPDVLAESIAARFPVRAA